MIEDNKSFEKNNISTNEKEIVKEHKDKSEISKEENAGYLLINIINMIGDNLHLPKEALVHLHLLNYPENLEILTKVIQTDQTPSRFYQGQIKLVLPDDYKNIQLSIRLKEKQSNDMQDLAFNKIDLQPAFENDDKWMINKYIDLEPVQSKNFSVLPQIYLQIRWFFKNKKYAHVPLVDVNELEKTLVNPIIPEKIISGILAFNIIKAKNLPTLQSFTTKINGEAFCQFYFEQNKKTKFKTDIFVLDTNLVWNKNQFVNLSDLKLNEKKTLKILFDVWEYSTFASDKFLGGVEFNLFDLMQNEGQWINNWFALKDEFYLDKKITGDVYLQLCYFQEGTNIQEIEIPQTFE